MSPEPSALSPAPTAIQREQVVQRLCSHFASNHLTMDELEQRIDQAYKAPSVTELDALVTGLPVLADDPSVAASDALVPASAPALPASVPDRDVLIGIMSGHTRRGPWSVPRHLKVFTVMGGIVLDLREALIAPGVSEIEITAIMASVEIFVPPGVRIECTGSAFMGAFEVDQRAQSLAMAGDERIIRVTGFAMMAGVEGKVRPPKDGKRLRG
ncbi:MAG TPA: DUF1707 domain-containing protein [Gemmatimonadaceae bacterium]|nr:DUF1707 domain-containing protein [Gemmatimonadaceae bacterium]